MIIRMYSTDLLYMKKDVLLNCRIMYQSGIQIISCRTEGTVKNSIEFFRSPFLPLFAINNWISAHRLLKIVLAIVAVTATAAVAEVSVV